MKPKNLLKRVLQFAREELERRARQQDTEGYDSTPPQVTYAADEGYAGSESAPASSPAELEPSAHGLEVLRPHAGGLLTLRWALSDGDVARAEALLRQHGDVRSTLCLRLVSFTKTRDDVLREVQDRPGIDLEGQCELHEPSQRAVVSLGLRAGERFVSISHHVL